MGLVPPSPYPTILNFRDIGSTINALLSSPSSVNADQRPQLRPNLLYRSAHLDNSSTTDRLALTETHRIRTIIDLRSTTEHIRVAQAKKDNEEPADNAVWKRNGITSHEINLNGGAFVRALIWRLSWASMAKLFYFLTVGYRTEAIGIIGREVMQPRGLVGLGKDSLEYSTWELREIFTLLANETNYPILLHCTQGKDRTGLVAMLVLLLCGVPVAAIEADYKASERELEVEREERIKEISRAGLGVEFVSCPDGFIESMVQHINEVYGGIVEYLTRIGVNDTMQNKIKSILLDKQ